GWEAAVGEGIGPGPLLRKVERELGEIKPWPGVVSPAFLSTPGTHVVTAKSHREELELLSRDVKDFKAVHKLDQVVMVNLGSTERHTEASEVHRSIPAFEAGLQRNDERISPRMKYLYLARKLGAPHGNFTPRPTKVPAPEALAGAAARPPPRGGGGAARARPT